ncbi:hypothetical protein [Azospirillum sp. B506]|nr:hypothetical protein [Azospirillum sp. B506]
MLAAISPTAAVCCSTAAATSLEISFSRAMVRVTAPMVSTAVPEAF